MTHPNYAHQPEKGHKLAGWPDWFKYSAPRYPGCPTCSEAMSELVFQLEFQTRHGYPYVGWFFQCAVHRDQLRFACVGD